MNRSFLCVLAVCVFAALLGTVLALSPPSSDRPDRSKLHLEDQMPVELTVSGSPQVLNGITLVPVKHNGIHKWAFASADFEATVGDTVTGMFGSMYDEAAGWNYFLTVGNDRIDPPQ